MDKNEIILEIGGEGGSLTLYGIRTEKESKGSASILFLEYSNMNGLASI